MRYPASEKLEIIRIAEQSHLPTRYPQNSLQASANISRARFSKFLNMAWAA
jgi:hypothetical protein